jgi:hypothetical protein
MWTTVKDLLKSKKALVAIVAAVVWVAGRVGLHIDQSELLGAVAPLWTYVLGQGIADVGKAKLPPG